MAFGSAHSLRVRLALGFAVAALALLVGLTLEAGAAAADPTPAPPVKSPPPSKPPLPLPFPPIEPTGPHFPESSPAEMKKAEKELALEKEEEEFENEKPESSCRHGFASSITNKLSVACMTEQAVDKIFGLPDGFGTKKLLVGLVRIPDFVSHSPSQAVGNAEWVTRSIAFALLMAVVTFALLHYLAAGMLSGGGGVFIDGVTRCVGAALLILAWPFIFENVANITNVITAMVIPQHSVDGGIGMIANAAQVGTVGMSSGLFVMIIFAVLLLVLLLVKLGLLIGLLIAFVGTPLALALWPIPSLSGPTTYAIRFVGMVFTVVILWGVCFRVFGIAALEIRAWAAHDLGFVGKAIMPLFGLASLGALLSVPRHAVQMWNVAPQKGTAGSTLQFAASNRLASAFRGAGNGGAGSRRVNQGQSRSAAAAKSGAGKGGSGSSGSSGSSGGGGAGGGVSGGGGAGGAAAAAGPQGQEPKGGKAGAQAARSGSGSGGKQGRGGTGAARSKGGSGGGGNQQRRSGHQRSQRGAAQPAASGQGAGRRPQAATGGGGSKAAPRPQGSGNPSAGKAPGEARRSSTAPRPAPGGGAAAPPKPRPGGSPANGGGKAPRPSPPMQQSPPPSSPPPGPQAQPPTK